LTEQGYLVPARYFSVSEPDLSRVRTVAGDYHKGDLEQAVNRPELVGDVVETWLQRAGGRRTVVFATSIDHSIALADAFQRQGVASEHVDAHTPMIEREQIFQRFRSGQTQVLTNCFLASYGFDLPDLACVVFARPTKSLVLYLQPLGRGLRPAPGKSDCLVLDHAGVVHRFGFATDERLWTLDGTYALEDHKTRQKMVEEKTLTCPECAAVFQRSRTCPECGYEFVPKGRMVETLDGELVEIGHGLPPELVDREAFYRELLGICHERGYRDGFAFHKYVEKFKAKPPYHWREMTPLEPSVETRRWVKSRNIAWAKSQRRGAA
jgi:superfamily II DNA or RNA helicase